MYVHCCFLADKLLFCFVLAVCERFDLYVFVCVYVCVDKCYLNNLSGFAALQKWHRSICINGLHTDVRMFCSLSFLPIFLLLCINVTIIFVQLVLLVCKHFRSCTKQKKCWFYS